LLSDPVSGVRLTILGFSRRERESPFEPADLIAREADGCKPLLAGFFRRDELRHGYAATFAHAAPVELNSREFTKSFGCEITGAAMWATDNRYFFNYEQRCASSIATGYWPNLNATATTVFTGNLPAVIPHI
jgi:hypothetical protein